MAALPRLPLQRRSCQPCRSFFNSFLSSKVTTRLHVHSRTDAPLGQANLSRLKSHSEIYIAPSSHYTRHRSVVTVKLNRTIFIMANKQLQVHLYASDRERLVV